MNPKVPIVIAILILASAAMLATLRFVVGGPEDDWICEDGVWVAHGNPSEPQPTGVCPVGSVSTPNQAMTPLTVADGFYKWYLAEEQNPLASKAYAVRGDVTEGLKTEVNELLGRKEPGGYDPFLCAQDKPMFIEVSDMELSGTTAIVSMIQTFNTGKRAIPVRMVKNGDRWQIDKVECGQSQEQTGKAGPQTETVIVYYTNSRRAGSDTDCALVYGTERPVTGGRSTYEQALNALFAGPTMAEKDQGYTSFFSAKTAGLLKKLTVLDEVAYVDLHDPRQLIPNASSSCGSQQFLSSIKETLMHDRQIKKVVFAIEGNQQDFYDWLQFGCPNQDTDCRDQHFTEN